MLWMELGSNVGTEFKFAFILSHDTQVTYVEVSLYGWLGIRIPR